MKRQKTLLSPGGWTALLLLLALGLWEATAAAGYVDPFFFSRPSLLWQEFWTMAPQRHAGPGHLSEHCPGGRVGVCCWQARWAPWRPGLGLSPRSPGP